MAKQTKQSTAIVLAFLCHRQHSLLAVREGNHCSALYGAAYATHHVLAARLSNSTL